MLALTKVRNRRGIDGAVYGLSRLTVDRESLIDLLNVLLELGESYKNIRSDEESASLDLAYPSAKRAEKLCRERGIEVKNDLFYGLPYLFFKLMRRPGLIAGILTALILLSLGSRVLWDVRIEGNSSLSEAEILSELSDHGVRPGVFLKSLDIGAIQTEIELENDSIAWISVNVIGTVAYVEVVEEMTPPAKAEPEGDGVNLIAERDGVIVGLEIIAGEPIAVTGQTVRKGELLVGGLVDSERFGYRAIEAKGKIFAVTERTFEVEIPYDYTVRTPEKREICEISLIFFSFKQKVFKKGGFLGSEYDTIYSDKYIYSLNGARIPVGLSVATRPIITETECKRTPVEAVDLAYYEINRMLLSDIPEAEILEKSYIGGETEDGSAYRLVCRVSCIDDIATPAPFYINPSE